MEIISKPFFHVRDIGFQFSRYRYLIVDLYSVCVNVNGFLTLFETLLIEKQINYIKTDYEKAKLKTLSNIKPENTETTK